MNNRHLSKDMYLQDDEDLMLQEPQEPEILHVLYREDGSVFAELMLTPSMAEIINTRRREKGYLTGEWKPQILKQYGLTNLDTMELVGKVFTMTADDAQKFNLAIPPAMRTGWVEATDAFHGRTSQSN